MKKKLVLFTALAVLFGVFFVISGKEAVRVQAAEGGVRIVEIWGNKAYPQQIAAPGIDETFGYVWAVRQDNGRYYVYYAKERGGKGRYLFQTQPDVTPEGIVFTDSDVYFTQDSADGLKHYAYQVNLSGTRKMTRLFGFKSKTAAKSSILNYYDGRIFYYYEDKQLVTIDVVPTDDVKDSNQFAHLMATDLHAQFPGYNFSIIVDHNYSE